MMQCAFLALWLERRALVALGHGDDWERIRGFLTELLDLVLPPEVIDGTAVGARRVRLARAGAARGNVG